MHWQMVQKVTKDFKIKLSNPVRQIIDFGYQDGQRMFAYLILSMLIL